MIYNMHTNTEMHEIIINTQKSYFKVEYPRPFIGEFHEENLETPSAE